MRKLPFGSNLTGYFVQKYTTRIVRIYNWLLQDITQLRNIPGEKVPLKMSTFWGQIVTNS